MTYLNCCIHRADARQIKKRGANAGWYKGANSTCRRHIASFHYAAYAAKCKAEDIPESKEAIPVHIRDNREKLAAKKGDAGTQKTLDGVPCKVELPTTFSQARVLDAVSKHIVCGNQVSQSIAMVDIYLLKCLI